MTAESSCNTCSSNTCSAKEKGANENDAEFQARQALAARLCRIKHKIVVLSGKGGVGKSTASVNLAAGLAAEGKRVGLLDIDIHGPSIPKLLKIEKAQVQGSDDGLMPVRVGDNLFVMSIGLLMGGSNDAIIWRGPMKHNAIQQFLRDVEWGDLDYLIVDCPPGTGDEPLAVVQLIGDVDSAVVVTTPQELAIADVRRSIMFCHRLELPVLGVLENMSGFICPHCNERVDIFGAGGGKALAAEMHVDFLGAVPMDLEVVKSGEEGHPVVLAAPEAESAKAFMRVVKRILDTDEKKQAETQGEQ